ncbi:MAG: tyrosine-type recombinase/integrase [Aggregatilineales bacterium]
MNFVEPIRSKQHIAHIKNLLKGQARFRDLLLFVVGMNSALRISDLLRLQIQQLIDEQGRIRSRFWIREEKRGKRQEVVINTSIREALQVFLVAYPNITSDPEHFVFFTTKDGDHIHTKAMRRSQAWKILSTICHQAGLRGNFGTHTLRKTWGYHARMQGVDLALIMAKLNHSSLAYTKRYLGITDDELQAVVQRLNL